MKTTSLPCIFLALTVGSAVAAPLTESTITEVIKQVDVLRAAETTPAKMNAVVRAPERVRTGAESRAELTAPDQTITRVGANTVFSFSGSERTLNLEKGSLLFHSPKGKGGGNIKSGGASAAVLGTTIIVVATADGGFKVIVLEGKGKATLPNGKSVKLKAGQLVFVLPNGSFSEVLDINLGKLVEGSLLVNGFSSPVASLGEIQKAIERQNKQIAQGRALDTGISPEEFANNPQIGNGLTSIDNNTYSALGLPFAVRDIFEDFGGNGQGQGSDIPNPDLPALFELQRELSDQFGFPQPQ